MMGWRCEQPGMWEQVTEPQKTERKRRREKTDDGHRGKILPRGRWVAESDIRRPMNSPSVAEKPRGGCGHGHPGA